MVLMHSKEIVVYHISKQKISIKHVHFYLCFPSINYLHQAIIDLKKKVFFPSLQSLIRREGEAL